MSLYASLKRSEVSRKQAFKWARTAGFSEAQVPWAALCAISLKSGRKGAPVFAGDVWRNLSVQHPHLFENPAQLQMDLGL
jgi:hypothetical protein